MTVSADDTPFQRRLLREIEAAKRKAAAKARRDTAYKIRSEVREANERLRKLLEYLHDVEVRVNQVDRAARERREKLNELLDAMAALIFNPDSESVVSVARAIYRKFRP